MQGKRVKRNWHPNFVEYCHTIIQHPNYSGMPNPYKKSGEPRWVCTKNSTLGQQRTEWWRQKATALRLPTVGKWIGNVAKANHPFRKRPCQICGENRQTRYVYPNKRTVKQINKSFEWMDLEYGDFISILDITKQVFRYYQIGRLSTSENLKGLVKLAKLLKITWDSSSGLNGFCKQVETGVIRVESRKLSPGAMSNAPDRLDGFHTYMICCRSVQDTGRHIENLQTYNQDRRAYEHWSEGDLKAASKLMRQGSGVGSCSFCPRVESMTADHIGPISLGFAHQPRGFQPLCAGCQSGKRDRLFPRDIQLLVELERNGFTVISWQAKGLWNRLKNTVNTDEEGESLAILLKRNQFAFLSLFYELYKAGFGLHLFQFLDANQFYNDIEFIGIEKGRYKYEKLIHHPGEIDQYHNNAGRYLRIAFDSLEIYVKKGNRRTVPVISTGLEQLKHELLSFCQKSTVLPHKLISEFNQTRRYTDKDCRSRLLLGVWKDWNDLGCPIDKRVNACIITYMKAIWSLLEKGGS